MNNVHYMTIADLRAEDPAAFDAAIKEAVFAAADDVGRDVVIRALSNAIESMETRKAA